MPTELVKSLSNEEEQDGIKNSSNNSNKHSSSRQSLLLNNKFATDKYNSLRRDLLVSNFDKTMTVEKARFEPTEESINTSLSAPALSTLIPQANITATAAPKKSDINNIPTNDDVIIRHVDSFNKTEISSSSEPPTATTAMTYELTMSPSAPTLSTNTHGNSLLTSTPLTTTHSLNNDKRRLTQVKSEGHQNCSSTNRKKQQSSNSKKQTKSVMHGTASPAEVFHRNLVDAVSNVEDSDENEHYVYPYYSGNESSNHHLSEMTGIHRPLSVRSTPVTLLNDIKKKNKGIFGDWLKYALSKKGNVSSTATMMSLDEEEEEVDEEWSGSEHNHSSNRRPKLRNNIKDHRSSHHHQNSSNKPSLLSRWHDSFRSAYYNSDKNLTTTRNSRRTYPPMQKLSSQQHAHYYNTIHGHNNNGGGNYGGYTSDEEDAPLLLSRRQPKRLLRNKKQTCKNICRNSILSIILAISLIFMIIVYKTQPLMELSVDMGRVLATDKELIFDLKVQAENWNWWTIHVADADISVFAFSQIVPAQSIISENDVNNTISINTTTHTRGVDPAEYLGNLVHFDEPLSIPSSLFKKEALEAITQIRIKSPGADASGNERWSRMIRYPYGLVVRGVLKYKPLPLIMGIYPQSAAVCNVTRVDPTTGTVSTDPDRTFCAGQDSEVDIFSRF